MYKLFLSTIALVLSIGALTFAYMGQGTLDDSSMRAEVIDAIDSYELNDANSTTVYQQQVTNGWVARDLLEILAKQNATMIENQALAGSQQSTTNLLLGINALIFALVGVSLTLKNRKPEPLLIPSEPNQASEENL